MAVLENAVPEAEDLLRVRKGESERERLVELMPAPRYSSVRISGSASGEMKNAKGSSSILRLLLLPNGRLRRGGHECGLLEMGGRVVLDMAAWNTSGGDSHISSIDTMAVDRRQMKEMKNALASWICKTIEIEEKRQTDSRI